MDSLPIPIFFSPQDLKRRVWNEVLEMSPGWYKQGSIPLTRWASSEQDLPPCYSPDIRQGDMDKNDDYLSKQGANFVQARRSSQ